MAKLLSGKQLKDGSVTGDKLDSGAVAWKDPVAVKHLVGNATIAVINGLTPTQGDAYVATDAGTPSAGTSDALTAGDIAEYDGTSWKLIVDAVGGFPPLDTRVLLATQTALITPYTDATDDGKVYTFSGASLTGTDTGDAVDGNAVAVKGDGSVHENGILIFSGATPTGTWEGGGDVIAGAGLTKTVNTLDVGDAGKGIQVNANDLEFSAAEAVETSGGLKAGSNSWELAIEPTDFAGTGLEDDGSDNLRLATQGNGISGGAGSTLSVDTDTETGGNVQGANVTANGVGLDVSAIAGTGLEADGSANLRIDEDGATVSVTGGTWTYTPDTLQVSGTPNSANDAVNKTYVDNVASGLQWREPVAVVNLIGNATVATLNGLTPASGDAYVALSAGTPTAGTSDLLAIGDLAEYDGTSWKKIISNSGGFVPSGTRAVLSTATALITPYTDATDDGKIIDFAGASNTGSDTAEATDGSAILVSGDLGVNENIGYVFNGVVATGSWVQFTGAGQINAGNGLTKSGNTLSVDVDSETGGNIQGANVTANGVGVDINAIAGTGLEADGSANLRLATQGNGISGGNGSTLSVDSDTETGSDIQGANITANGVGLDIGAIAGTGVEADGSANLRLATQGNGIAGGAGSTLSVDSDTETGSNIQGANITANGVGVDIAAIAGTGIEADGSANLRVAAQGNGLTGGAGTTLSVLSDDTSIGVAGSGVTAAQPGTDNLNMTGSVTAADDAQATATTVVGPSANGGRYALYVNGQLEDLREDKNGSAFISGNAGVAARAFADVIATDTVHWIGSQALYELDANDILDLHFNPAV